MNYHFQCVDCNKEYKAGELEYVCPACTAGQKPMEPTRGVLKVIYDYPALKKNFTKEHVARCAGKGMERYLELLPLSDPSTLPPLQVGVTPLYCPERLSKELGLKNLYIKDDTVLPTGSFKDRASALVVAKARELKKDTVVCASTGNAATALAGMCASVGMKCVIFAPAAAPPAKLTQILAYGARLIPVDGTYDDAFELSLAATREFGWYNRNTAFNPFTVEGKKTVAYEIWEQFGYGAPDKIFIPTGDGVILTGVYKGFWDLLQLGLIKKIPQLIAVQAEGSSVIVKMLNSPTLSSSKPLILSSSKPLILSSSKDEDWHHERGAHTIADSICVSVPRNARWAVAAIKETGGYGVTVTDDEIISAIVRLSSMTGIFPEPAAAAAAAGLFKVACGNADSGCRGGALPPPEPGDRRGSPLHTDEKIVLLITGTGLKDIAAAQKGIKLPKPIPPRISEVKKII